MKTTHLGLVLLSGLTAFHPPFAGAQQAPKLPAGTDIRPPPVMLPQPPVIPNPRDHLAQVPAGAWPGAGTQESRQAEVALLSAQTESIKSLARRLGELESRVQQLEAAKKAGAAK